MTTVLSAVTATVLISSGNHESVYPPKTTATTILIPFHRVTLFLLMTTAFDRPVRETSLSVDQTCTSLFQARSFSTEITGSCFLLFLDAE